MACELCSGTTKNGNRYCSKECEQDHYAYVEISIPKQWVRNTVMRTAPEKRYAIISSFAKRHSYRLDLVVLRLERQYGVSVERR